MRRTAFLAGLVLSVLIFTNNSPQASADKLPLFNKDSVATNSTRQAIKLTESVITEQVTTDTSDKPVTHLVEPGESLSKIAAAHGITWQRIYDKNLQISDPNVISAGDEIMIPEDHEQLTPRPVPVQQPTVNPSTPSSSSEIDTRNTTTTASRTVSQPRGDSNGNRYSYGYCTWYAKNRRPDLPNNLGNANTWVARARAQGLPTGSAPRVGAIGQQGMHVVYVEAVNANGTVTVSEMNFKGFNVISSRTVPASNFQYIY